MTGVPPVLARIRALTALYLGATAATLGFVAVERDDDALVDADVWTHALLVFGFALLLVDTAHRAARGARSAFLRLRAVSVVLVVVSVVLALTPGMFPTWMRIEQGAYALLLAVVACLATGHGARALFEEPRPRDGT